jgi:hypothetical protein
MPQIINQAEPAISPNRHLVIYPVAFIATGDGDGAAEAGTAASAQPSIDLTGRLVILDYNLTAPDPAGLAVLVGALHQALSAIVDGRVEIWVRYFSGTGDPEEHVYPDTAGTADADWARRTEALRLYFAM